MSKNKTIIIVLSIILIVCFIICIIIKKDKKMNNEQDDKIGTQVSDIQYDEKTNLFYVKNLNTEEIIFASYEENDLNFYKNHPDYNPNPLIPRSTNIEDFVEIVETVEE